MFKITIENMDSKEITQEVYKGYILGGITEDGENYDMDYNCESQDGCFLTDMLKREILDEISK